MMTVTTTAGSYEFCRGGGGFESAAFLLSR
jgi:hypothetical protein